MVLIEVFRIHLKFTVFITNVNRCWNVVKKNKPVSHNRAAHAVGNYRFFILFTFGFIIPGLENKIMHKRYSLPIFKNKKIK